MEKRRVNCCGWLQRQPTGLNFKSAQSTTQLLPVQQTRPLPPGTATLWLKWISHQRAFAIVGSVGLSPSASNDARVDYVHIDLPVVSFTGSWPRFKWLDEKWPVGESLPLAIRSARSSRKSPRRSSQKLPTAACTQIYTWINVFFFF